MHDATPKPFSNPLPSGEQSAPRYAPDAGNQTRSIISTAIIALLYLALLCFHLFATPRFTTVYDHMDMELPMLTNLIVTAPPLLLTGACMMVICLLVAKELIPGTDDRIKSTANRVALILLVLIFAVYVAGLVLPLSMLQNSGL